MKKLLILAFLLTAGLASAQNQYFVSNSGNDANNGTSSGTPWQHISFAVSHANLTGGATITVHAGTYTENIACGGHSGPLCMNRSGPSVSQRFRIQCDAPFSVPSGSGCLLRNASSTGGIIANANNIDIVGFDYTNPAQAVGAEARCTATSGQCPAGNSVHLINNYLHDIGQTFVDSLGGPGCPSFGAIFVGSTQHGSAFQTDIQVIGNRISNYGDQTKAIRNGGSCNFAHGIYSDTPGALIENNVVIQAIAYGIHLYSQPCSTVISNNTVDQAGKSDVIVGGGTCGTGGSVGRITIDNNILGGAPAGGITLGASGTAPCTSTSQIKIANNLVATGTGITNGSLNACTTVSGTITEAPTTTFNGYSGTSTTNSYLLKTGSGAIGNGVSSPGGCVSGGLVPCVPSTDFTGAARPLSGAQDIGAYKFVGAGVPIVSLTPSPLAFGTVAVSANSSLTATLTNTGGANLTFSAATISGTNAADFSITSTTCASPLAALGSCTYTIRFAPSAAGARSASLTLNDNAAGSPHQLPLTGSGGTGIGVLSPNPAAFGVVAPGSCSAAQSIILTNTGSGSFTQNANSTITPNQLDFQFASPIGSCNIASLAPGASCTTNVKFCPAGPGARSATFNAFTDANDPTASLTGTGGAPVVSLTPSSAACGNQQVGTSSTCQAFTLTNTGNIDLTGIVVSIQ